MKLNAPGTRWGAKSTHKPLRTNIELAEELGVTLSKFTAQMRREGAPVSKLHHRTPGGRKVYYEPNEVRAWWKINVTNNSERES